ncbi:hypothetical protein EVG20_g11041, partial [Dentipellis fragilis]
TGTYSGDKVLGFWEVNAQNFPTLFSMAMDFMPIQATSVPCERVFSSSAETDMKKRNRLGPEIMEALQILKFMEKNNRLDFTKGWQTSERDMRRIDRREGQDVLGGLIGQGGDAVDVVDRLQHVDNVVAEIVEMEADSCID